MTPVAEVGLVVQRELRRNFRSVKGILLGLISLLGGTGAALLLVKVQQFKRAELADMSAEQMQEGRTLVLEKLTGDEALAKHLALAPEVLLMVFNLTVWLTPMLIALIGFDSLAGDLQHKSTRYWSVRTRRGSYFSGKFFGLFTTVTAITFVMHALVWGVCVARGEATAAATFTWGLRLWVASLPMSAAWCAIATLVSSLLRTPFLALLVTFATFFVLWLVYVIGSLSEPMAFLTYVYPNRYDLLLLSPRIDKAMTGLAACSAFAAVLVGAGSALFARRDV